MATVSPHVASLATIVGRDADLRDLRAGFVHSAATPAVQVLNGMGGVGKTSLARMYAQRHLEDYGIVWWVRAEDPAAIDAEFRSLLEVLLPPGDTAKISDPRAKAFALLARQEEPWLLVLDNVPGAAAALALLPPAGMGHILITSRAIDWPAATTVHPLATGAAVELLTTLSGDHDSTAAETLAAELGHLPLALTQAAGFVRTNAIDLTNYLRLYRDRSAELHAEGRPADYPHTVATTWQLAMDRLSANSRQLLNVLAFYAPDAIPVHTLFASMDELVRYRAIGELRGYSLVALSGSDTVTVHRLVQAVTRNQLRADLTYHEWADTALTLVTQAIPDEERRHFAATIAQWKALHTHVLAVLGHVPPERQDVLSTRHDLAFWTWKAGDTPQARDMFIELQPVRERVLGIEHPDALTTRMFAATVIGWSGDAARARDLCTELLPIRERVLGADHPHTLHTRTGVAWWTGVAGNAGQARDLCVRLLKDRERVQGPDHIETLVERNNVAHWTGHAGDPSLARDMYANLVADRTRVLGPYHPHTLASRHHHTFWIGAAGDELLARDLAAELLPMLRQVMGADDQEALECAHNMAFWVGRTGDPARARDMFAELLPIRERVLGPESPETIATRRQLEEWTVLAQGGFGDGGAEAGVEVAEEGAGGAGF